MPIFEITRRVLHSAKAGETMGNSRCRIRNLGTRRHERGSRNKMVVPLRTYPEKRYYLENLGQYTTEKHCIGAHELLFVTETPRARCAHACSIEEIVCVLNHVPGEDLRLLKFVVLRQPKRKEELLRSAYGRWCPDVKIGKLRGNAIFLEVQDMTKPLRWEKPLSTRSIERLERLRQIGHTVIETPRRFEIFFMPEALRQSQLYETLPHEIGHHRHWLTDENYWHRTNRECEDFAERYEREFTEKFGPLLR